VNYLSTLDYLAVAFYFLILVGLGVWLSRRASRSVEDYFLAGRAMPWWALGVSGMTAWFDLAGTALITSFLFMLGPRGLFIELRGGVGIILPIMLLWTGKWHYRSGVMTGAEWMAFRFGDGTPGQIARLLSALALIVSTIGMLAYAMKGVGLFFSMFLPFSPITCALMMVAVTTVYTMMSGFYGVVYSNFFQGLVIIIGAVAVCTVAVVKIADVHSLAAVAAAVTGNVDWTNSTPQWHTTMPAGYELYENLTMFAFFYLLKGIIQGMGWGDDPRYFGARSERECANLTLMWGSLMTFRWPLMMAFAAIAIIVMRDLFPDQGTLALAAQAVKDSVGVVDKSQWVELLSRIINAPQEFSPALIAKLQSLLGGDWATKLNLVSFEGTINPERVVPAAMIYGLPAGMRGLIIVALLAAEMSTFSTTVNRAAGYFTRDLYQRFIRPRAGNRELITASWLAVVGLVLIAVLFAYTIRSVNDVWAWITMGLGSGLLMPTFLRFYWWRFNGAGFAAGTAVGMAAAILQRLIYPDMDERMNFLLLGSIGLIAAIIATYLSKPTDMAVLRKFYEKTRPFGFWGKFKAQLPPEVQANMVRERRRDIGALPFAIVAQVSLYLLPIQLIIGSYSAAAFTLPIFLSAAGGLYLIWYRKLPHDAERTTAVVGGDPL
jgi:solute:Na+ symporter, SSS family